MWVLWTLLIINLFAQGLVAVGLLGILVSAFSDSFRERLTTFVYMLFIGVLLTLISYWTLVALALSACPGGYCF